MATNSLSSTSIKGSAYGKHSSLFSDLEKSFVTLSLTLSTFFGE